MAASTMVNPYKLASIAVTIHGNVLLRFLVLYLGKRHAQIKAFLSLFYSYKIEMKIKQESLSSALVGVKINKT